MRFRTRLLSGAFLTAGLLAAGLGIVTSAEVSRPAVVFDQIAAWASLPDLRAVNRMPDLRRLLDRRTIRAFVGAAQDPAPAPAVKTDKADYHPFEIVTVTGTGWQPDETVELVFKEDPLLADQEEITLYAVAEPDGTFFNDKFVTDFHDAGITFTLIATGKSSGKVATTTFTDSNNAAGNLDQCANASPASGQSPPCVTPDTSWQNGNINDNQGNFLEGDSVPYRLRLSNLALTNPGNGTPIVHRVTIAWDSTQSGKHAIDYITTFDRTVAGANPCSDVPGCDPLAFDTENIPLDLKVKAGPDGVLGTLDDIAQLPGVFTLYGGTIQGVQFPTTITPTPPAPPDPYALASSGQCTDDNGSYAGNSTTCVTISFIATVTNPVLAWGGHIATRKDWGASLSAIAITGSPYHTRFVDLDGSGGNQDRALAANAVFFPAALTIIKQTVPSPDNTDFTFTTTGTALPASFTLNTSSGITDRKIFSLTDTTTRTVTEQGPPSGWTFTSLTCAAVPDPQLQKSGTVSTNGQTASVTPAEGETITCTYVNTKRPKLTVVKVVLPASDSGKFNLRINGTTHATDVGDGGTTEAQNANIGSNSFGETAGTGTSLADYVTTISGEGCSDNGDGTGAITLAAGDDKTCTITNTRKGKIVVVKDAQPNDPQDFKFTAGGGLSPALFFLDDDGDDTLSNTRTFSGLAPGSGYSVAESVPGGWTQASATCSDDSPIAAIDVGPGETVTCTFVNTKKPRLTVVKVLVPASDSGKFNLQINGTTHATDVGDAGTTGAQEGIVGSNSFGETAGTGTSLADYVTTISGTGCTDNGDGTGAITLAAGEDKTCTITNTRRGTIVIVKDAVPDDQAFFKFTAGGGLSPDFFTLDDNTDPTRSNTQTFSGLAPGSSYFVNESVPGGWEQSSASCSDGSPISAIDVGPGETVTCTFVNTKKPRLTVVKVLVPASDSGKFNLLINGTTHVSDVGDGGSTEPQYATIGSNSFGETAGTGTSLADYVTTISGAGCTDTGGGTGSITLAAGDDKTCTITNTRKGKIVVVKDALPNDAQDFKFTAGGGLSPALFFLDDDGDDTLSNTQTFSGLAPGSTYSISEGVPDGWVQTSATCSDNSPITAIDVSAGETVTCTFTNTKNATITVKKVMVGGTATFGFTGTPNGSISTNEGTITASVAPGTYYSTEGVVAGWDLNSISCDDSDSTFNVGTRRATFKAAAGESVTCTFTNTKRGGIIVKKATVPSGATGSFTFAGTAAGTIGDGGEIVVANLVPGTYYSTEANPTPAFDLTNIVCDDSDSSGVVSTRKATFSVSAGETVTCTFTNTQRGKAKVIKTVSGVPPSGTQAFTFQLRQGATTVANGTTLESIVANAANGGLLNFATNLVPGQTYQLCEIVMPGWNTTLGEFVPDSFYPPDGVVPNPMVDNSILCVNFTVTAGETKTFTVNNTPPPGGRALTIGFWKNWASCSASKGGQKPVLDQVLATFPVGFAYVVPNPAPPPGEPAPVGAGIYIGYLYVNTCQEAVALLNKSTLTGKKKASDPLFNLAAQLMAAVLNVNAGAGICPNNMLAIQNAQALLYKYKFNGNTYSKPTASDANKANQLAAYLDAYNNTTACPAVPPPS